MPRCWRLWGVEVVKIMVLARWAGEAVLRYVREAPLDTLPAEVKDLEEKHSMLAALERLQADMHGLDARVEGRHALGSRSGLLI